jgi:hypothetical protein
VIRFGVVASVVTGAVALLIVGALSGDLALVYLSIGLAALALVLLVVGVAVWRDQVFAGTTRASGAQVPADQRARPHPSPIPGAPAQAGSLQGGRSAPAEDRRARGAAGPGWPARPAGVPVAPANALGEHEPPGDRPRPDRERDGRQSGSGRQRPAAAGRPGRQRDTVPADWAGPEPPAESWTGHEDGPQDRPRREVRPSARRVPRKPGSAEPQPAERAGAAEPSARWPDSAESYPSVEHPEPADDPTRLAHKLGIGRQAGTDTDSPAPSARPAEATARSRTRPEQAADSARAAEKEHAPPASGPATAGRPETAAEPAAPGPALAGTRAEPPSGEAVPTATASASASTAAAEDAAGPAPASPEAAAANGAASQAVQDGAPADTEVLVVPGIARYHQAGCILIRFLGEDDLQRMSRQEADAAGCAACRACRP